MLEEYFCESCGLFHWKENSNDECPSCHAPSYGIFRCNSFGFAYFVDGNPKRISRIKWSSPKYAPEHAIEIYKKQGTRIVE